MFRKNRVRVAALALGLAACGIAAVPPLRAQDAVKEAGASKPDDSPVVSDVRVRTLAESNYLYVESETSYAEMGPFIEEAVKKLEAAEKEGKIRVTNSYVFVYQGASPDPSKKFKLQVGATVADDVAAVGDLKVRKLPTYRCASVLYQGPVQQMMLPYQKLMPALEPAGLEPTGENREYYTFWEGEASKNNIVMVTAGVKEKAGK